MTEQVAHIQTIVRPILHRHGVVRSSLFGSYARGDAGSTSDVDLLVELPKNTGMFAYVRLKRELEDALKRKVDLVTYRSVHPLLKKHIEHDELRIL